MAITGIGTAYSNYQNTIYQKTQKASSGDFYGNILSASERTDVKNESDVLGLTMIKDESSNTFYGMRAQYAEGSTDENPIVQVTSNWGGKTVSYNVNIYEVDPKNASQLEMFALCSYSDDKGMGTGNTFGSYQTLKYYSINAEDNGYCSDLGGIDNFKSLKLNWEELVSKMKSIYYNAGLFGQYKDGMGLMNIFSEYSKN